MGQFSVETWAATGSLLSGNQQKKGLWSLDAGAIFLPVDLPALQETPREVEPAPPVPVELRLAGGRCLRFDSVMDAAALTRLIRAVEKA